MAEFYSSISIRDNDNRRYLAAGINSMHLRAQNIFKEAAGYREHFAAFAESRLREAELDTFVGNPLYPVFVEANPRKLFVNLLMLDFYNAVPTSTSCFESKTSQRTALKIISESVKSKICVQEKDPEDHRRKMLFPTLNLIQAHEQRDAKITFRLAARTGRLGDSEVVKNLIEYEKLRVQYLPFEISSKVSFDLTSEFLNLGAKKTTGNPYL